jgi:Skp family chaperone for outer membrane proteins
MRALVGGGWFRQGAVALCLLLASVGSLDAQQKPEILMPIATLDQERFFNETRFGQAVLAAFQSDTDALIAENRKIEADLEVEERDLTIRRTTMAVADFQVLADAFDRKVEDIRTARDATSQALTKRLDEDRARFFEAARPVLVKLMAERGVLAVIDKRAVLLGFDTIDLTDLAIARLDETLGDGAATPPEASPTP